MSDLPLHLALRPLTLEDLDAVHELESLGFPPNERCSLETLKYRLKTCPELTNGLFIREFKTISNPDGDIYRPEGSDSLVKEKLIGFILATKIDGEFVTEASMSYPGSPDVTEEGVKKGHIEESEIIGIHSIVVHPDYQKKNLATLMLRDFKQKLSNQQVGLKISLISKVNLIKFYERLGFVNKGKSKCTHGGEEWYDLQVDLIPNVDE